MQHASSYRCAMFASKEVHGKEEKVKCTNRLGDMINEESSI